MRMIQNATMKFIAFALITIASPVLAQTSVDAVMTVDNQFTAYISTDDTVQGDMVGSGADWPTQDQFNAALTPGVTNYLHITATDVGPPAMFIGEFTLSDTGFEFSNGTQSLLTNTTGWQVSLTGFGADYSAPSDLGPNGTAPWGTFDLIDASALFIWYPGTSGNTVYVSTDIISNGAPEPGVTTATFEVPKVYTDGNPDDVEVTLSCNNGLPLTQSFMISDSNPVTFVLTGFTEGAADCTVTETGSANGYTAGYDNGSEPSDTSCVFTDVVAGNYSCAITNVLEIVEITITKEWDFDPGADGLNSQIIVEFFCENIRPSPDGPLIDISGSFPMDFDNSTSFGFVFPNYTTPVSRCRLIEKVLDSAIESDQGCAQWMVIMPGDEGTSCTITNTVFFEGIPTLSQYGLALMALLVLGVGLVGFRRFA